MTAIAKRIFILIFAPGNADTCLKTLSTPKEGVQWNFGAGKLLSGDIVAGVARLVGRAGPPAAQLEPEPRAEGEDRKPEQD